MEISVKDLENCFLCNDQLEVGVYKINEDRDEQFCSKKCAREFWLMETE